MIRKTGLLSIGIVCSLLGMAQLTSGKDGDIKFNDKLLAEIKKYEGSAETRPKFCVLNVSGDTLVKINFRKEFSYDWMQFYFPAQSKTIEVNTSDIIKGLNYRKNIGSFLVSNNLVTEQGKVDDKAFAALAEKYNEDLSKKYFDLNETNRVIASSKFEYSTSDNKLYINGKHVGFASIPDGQQAEIRGIILYDANNKQIGKGDVGLFADLFTMSDGRELKLGVKGKTVTSSDKYIFGSSLLRELFRNGYYKI